MRFIGKLIFGLFVTAVALTACATGEKQRLSLDQKLANKGFVVGEQVRRIRDYQINGWSYLDDRHIIIQTGVKGRYLVSLKTTCVELGSAMSISFSTLSAGLTDFDRLSVRGPSRYNETCLIDTLHKLDKVKSDQEKG